MNDNQQKSGIYIKIDNAKKIFKIGIAGSIIMLILGILMVLWPLDVQMILIRIVSAVLILIGAVGIIMLLKAGQSSKRVAGIIFFCIVTIFGIIFMVNPGIIVGFLNVLFGIILLMIGISSLYQSAVFARAIYTIILSVLEIILGVVVIVNPFSSAAIFMIAVGIILIFNAVSNLIIFITTKKIQRKTESEVIESTARELDDN